MEFPQGVHSYDINVTYAQQLWVSFSGFFLFWIHAANFVVLVATLATCIVEKRQKLNAIIFIIHVEHLHRFIHSLANVRTSSWPHFQHGWHL